MTDNSLFATREAAIKAAVEALFSDGVLSDKIQQATMLSELPGLDLFMTAVPWRIVLNQSEAITGYSENLHFACRDIEAQLWGLAKTLPSDANITIGIDEARLTTTPRTTRFPTIEGG